MQATPFYHRETEGMRVTVRPLYLPAQSHPADGHFVFAYFVRIENVSERPAQLLRRHWFIHDAGGEDTEVEGEGVVGQQPVIPPGGVHEYSSYCVLNSPNGHMEGRYHFVRPDGSRFAAEVPRFLLTAIGPRGPLH